jgi:hypothetical protein
LICDFFSPRNRRSFALEIHEMATHKFIVSTDDVNEYKYRVLTDGIETIQYMKNPIVLFQHERWSLDDKNKGREVIGKCIALTKENGKLIAEIEFDVEDDFAKLIEGKVARGFIRMTSIYAEPLATSMEPQDVLPGQMFETVTKCKLIEISIVDIGGNDGALKLSLDGKPVQLNKLEQNKNESMSLKTVALTLGLSPDAGEDTVLSKIQEIKLAQKTAEDNLTKLKGEVEAGQETEATELVDKAIKLGLFPEALKNIQLTAFKGDFNSHKVTLSKLISEKETEANKTTNVKLLNNFLTKPAGARSAEGGNEGDVTFLKLSKDNPTELIRLKREEPDTFIQLFEAQYGKNPVM